MDGRMDGWIDGWMDGWMEERDGMGWDKMDQGCGSELRVGKMSITNV